MASRNAIYQSFCRAIGRRVIGAVQFRTTQMLKNDVKYRFVIDTASLK